MGGVKSRTLRKEDRLSESSIPLRKLLTTIIGLCVWVTSGGAMAQIDARQFEPSPDPAGGTYLEPVLTPGGGQFNAAFWTRYAYHPVSVRAADGTVVARPFDHQISSDLVANLGVGGRLAFALDLPLVLYQNAIAGVDKTALGDLALVGKFNLRGYDDLGGFGLALLARQTAPTGGENSFVSDHSPKTELRLLAEYKLIALSVQATAGFTLRTADRIVGAEAFRDSIPWGIGATLRPQAFGIDEKGHWTWGIEVHGAYMLPASSAQRDLGAVTAASPVLADLTARYGFEPFSLVFAGETSFTRALGAPTFAAIVAFAWAPRIHDMDGDGIPDDVDQCPELPEDRDGVEDEDGCPDFDANGK
jgi:hypothetical protein